MTQGSDQNRQYGYFPGHRSRYWHWSVAPNLLWAPIFWQPLHVNVGVHHLYPRTLVNWLNINIFIILLHLTLHDGCMSLMLPGGLGASWNPFQLNRLLNQQCCPIQDTVGNMHSSTNRPKLNLGSVYVWISRERLLIKQTRLNFVTNVRWKVIVRF